VAHHVYVADRLTGTTAMAMGGNHLVHVHRVQAAAEVLPRVGGQTCSTAAFCSVRGAVGEHCWAESRGQVTV